MRILGTFLLTAAVLLAVHPAFAQAPAGAKQRGEYTFYGNSAGRAMQSARDYSQEYRTYAKATPTVNPEVARAAADGIGDYIVKAQKHFAYMRKQADAGKDKETLTALDSIDKNLAAAAKSHADMKETCLKDNVDGAATMECCKTIDADLAKAIAEHDKLMKKLAGKK